MADRNTSIRRQQLQPIRQDDFDATNSPSDNYIPSYDLATGKFTWVAQAGGDNLDVVTVGANGDYTTIQGALDSLSGAGATILVSEGTYSEAITMTQDNVALIATGSKLNTIITQITGITITSTGKTNIWIEGFTVNITEATNTTDYCVRINDALSTADNIQFIFKNCDFNWTSSVALQASRAIYNWSGSILYQDCKIEMTNTYAGTSNNLTKGLFGGSVDDVTKLINCDIVVNHSGTSTIQGANGIGLTAGHKLLMYGGSITVNSDCQSVAIAKGIGCSIDSYFELHDVVVIANATSTGKAQAFQMTDGDCLIYGGSAISTTGDGDGLICFENGTGSLTAYGLEVGGDLSANSGTFNAYNITDISGRLLSKSGVVIGQDNYDSTYHIDDASQGADSGILYIGNKTINTTFTGYHFYQLGDTDLEIGECVSLIDGKIYRTTSSQDSKCIGIYQGVTNSRDSMGNVFVVRKQKEETYWDEDTQSEKTRNVVDTGKYGKVSDPLIEAVASDFAYSVACMGDSYDIHSEKTLIGARVLVKSAEVLSEGDYLQSSDTPGYLEKQDDDVLHNYTIAKLRQPLTETSTDVYVYLLN